MPNLSEEVWNEDALMELFGMTREQIDILRRSKGLPCIQLNQRIRVYLASDILKFLQGLTQKLNKLPYKTVGGAT